MDSTRAVLSVRKLSKAFGGHQVLRTLSFELFPHETVLILGANGAGKSTLLRVLAGLASGDGGSVDRRAGDAIGFASHHTLLYGRLSVRENLKLFARVSGRAVADVESALRMWGIADVASKSVAELSKGNQAKVSLARAALGEPSVLLLDEPSSNLDERATEILKSFVRAQRSRGVSVIATHDLHRLGDLATRVIAMDKGGILADSGPSVSSDDMNRVIAQYREANR